MDIAVPGGLSINDSVPVVGDMISQPAPQGGSGKPNVAILTNFMEFQPGYSLTGIVKDQIRMLREHGHNVKLFVNSKYHGEDFDGIQVIKKIPFTHLKDYTSKADVTDEHKTIAESTADMLMQELRDTDVVFTHDFVFTGWFLPYGLGCMRAGKEMPFLAWMHWIHSIPTAAKDWWNIRVFGPTHKLIYPNVTDSIRVAEAYRGTRNDVRVIPHIKDMRTFMNFSPEACKFIKDYPAVMQSDIVQIYPASVDRLSAKRVAEVIEIFANFKKFGKSVCLVIANQWATTKTLKESLKPYKDLAAKHGLVNGVDFIFTSDWQNGKYSVGVPHDILVNLMMCANMFIFPTREESFGLVLPEMALASGAFCVVNRSLTMQLEVSGMTALNFDFGSFSNDHSVPDKERYLRDVAKVILGRMLQNESINTKTHMRKTFNYDNLYNQYYMPIMAETEVW